MVPPIDKQQHPCTGDMSFCRNSLNWIGASHRPFGHGACPKVTILIPKFIIFCSWLLLIFLRPGLALSTEVRQLDVDVSYPGTAVTYYLFKNDLPDPVCFIDPSYSPAECIVELDDAPMSFTLTAVDAAGEESPRSAPYIVCPPPKANFTASAASGAAPLSISFEASSSSDSCGFIDRWIWDFGDGVVGSGAFIDHIFTSPGIHTVWLTVVNDAGVSSTVKTSAITVTTPTQSFTYTWDYDVSAPGVTGFRLYKNGVAICETSNPLARTLTCQFPKISGPQAFFIKAIGEDNTESSPSNTIIFDPNAPGAPLASPPAKNSAPMATDQVLTLLEDSPANGTLTATDPDSDPLTFWIVTPPIRGVATLTNPRVGTFTYKPAANSNGSDSFVYQVNDGLSTATAKVTVTIVPVNDAPTAAAFTLSTTEDVMASGKLSGHDADGDALTYSIVTNGSKGTAAITNASTGAFTYTPAANKNGRDSFVYRVSDGVLAATATVTVTIAPVNDAPVANPDAVTLECGKKALIDVVANDTDIDGDTVSVATLTTPAHGHADIVDGKILYTANVDFSGADSFSYTINDGAGGTAIGTVAVTVVIPVRSITYTWDYTDTVPGLAGFKLYMNDGLICKTSNPAARTLTCNVPISAGGKSFYLTAIYADTTETALSNSLVFAP